jgi:serine/threonine protein kinase
MLRMLSDDVFKKYKLIDVIGHGSMGYIAKAKIRTEKVGGSAVPDKKGFLKKKKGEGINELRTSEVRYALKSIQVDRVSDNFKKELRNEIDILKVLDHPNIIRAYESYEKYGTRIARAVQSYQSFRKLPSQTGSTNNCFFPSQ